MSGQVQRRRRRVSPLWMIVLLGLAVLFVGVLLRSLGSVGPLGAMVLQHLNRTIGHEIVVDSLRVRVFPEIVIEAHEPRILHPSSEDRIVTADRLEFAVEVLPLLGGRVVGKRLIVEAPRVLVRRDAAGRWGIPLTRPATPSSDTEESSDPLAFLRIVPNALLTDGRLTLVDAMDPEHERTVQLSSLHAILSRGLTAHTTKVQLFGERAGEAGAAGIFSIDGLLLRPRPEEGADPSVQKASVEFDGKARVHGVSLWQLADWVGAGGQVSEGAGTASVTLFFRLSTQAGGYDLTVTEWKADIGGLSLKGDAALTGWGTPQATISASLSSAAARLDRWIGLVPVRWKSKAFETFMKDYEPDALVTVRRSTVSGAIETPATFAVTGEVDLRDGRLSGQGELPAVQHVSARVQFDQQSVRAVLVEGQYGPVQLTRADLAIRNFSGDTPVVEARVSTKAPAAGLVHLAAKFAEPGVVDRVVPYLQQVNGEVSLEAHVEGPPNVEQLLARLAGEVSLEEVAFRAPQLALSAGRINGQLAYGSGALEIKTLSANIGPAQVEVQGALLLGPGARYRNLAVQVLADARTLAEWSTVGGTPSVFKGLEGRIHVVSSLSGLLPSPRIQGYVQLKEAGWSIPNLFTKSAGIPASIEFDGRVTEDFTHAPVIAIRRFDLRLPPVRIHAQGWVRPTEEMEFKAEIRSRSFAVEQLPKGISFGPLAAGHLDTSLTVTGGARKIEAWQASGRLRLENGLVALDRVRDPIRDLSLDLRFDGSTIDIERATLTLRDSEVRVSGAITAWTHRPKASLVVESAALDLEALVPKEGGPSDQDSESFEWPDVGRLTANVRLQLAYYQRFLFTDLSGVVTLERGAFMIERVSGVTDEGQVTGGVTVRAKDHGRAQVDSEFQVTGVPVQRVLAALGQREALTGWLSVTGKVNAEVDREGWQLSSIATRRPIRVALEHGHIIEAPVMSKLLSVLNLPALLEGRLNLTKDGLPYDTLKGVVEIGNGTLTVKEVFLNSPVLKVSGSGQYDLIGDQLDLVVATSPLGSYSSLLKDVPLFGTLMAGDREGFDTAVFQVKGSTKDVQLEYLPVDSFARGVKGTAKFALDVLTNALNLPRDVLLGTK